MSLIGLLTTTEKQIPLGRPHMRTSGRSEPIMGEPERLCLSTNSPDSKYHKQDSQPRLSEDYSHSSRLAQHGVLLESSEPVIPDPPLPATPNQPSNPTIQ